MNPMPFTDWLFIQNLSATDGAYERYLGYVDNYYLGETEATD